jgi:hypothetical protein
MSHRQWPYRQAQATYERPMRLIRAEALAPTAPTALLASTMCYNGPTMTALPSPEDDSFAGLNL